MNNEPELIVVSYNRYQIYSHVDDKHKKISIITNN